MLRAVGAAAAIILAWELPVLESEEACRRVLEWAAGGPSLLEWGKEVLQDWSQGSREVELAEERGVAREYAAGKIHSQLSRVSPLLAASRRPVHRPKARRQKRTWVQGFWSGLLVGVCWGWLALLGVAAAGRRVLEWLLGPPGE